MSEFLRQSDNKILAVGVLKEKNLELVDYQGQKTIRGTVVIEAGEDNEITFNCFTQEKIKNGKNAGQINPSYKSLFKVITEHVSSAEIAKGEVNATEPDIVRVTGANFRQNDFYSGNELISNLRYNASFISRVKNPEEETQEAYFETEIFTTSIRDELDDDGEPTGKLIVEGIGVGYKNEAILFEFIAEEPTCVEYIKHEYVVNKTSTVRGQIIKRVEVEKTVTNGFGANREDVSVNTIKKLLITGGEYNQKAPEEGGYSKEQIDEILKQREEMLANKKAESKSSATPVNSSYQSVRNRRNEINEASEEEEDDVPW